MLSKNKIKFINSIKKKKYRDINVCFFAEGEKLIDELLNSSLNVTEIFATSDWVQSNLLKVKELNIDTVEVSELELKKISSLSTPNKVFAIAKQPNIDFDYKDIGKELSLFLENINDPGNLGTIIRLADWFGIKNVFCTKESVDMYNPKVVQSSMGAIYRTKVHYVDSIVFFNKIQEITDYNIYGTFLEGDNIYKEELKRNGLIIMGSESHGISNQIKSFVTKKLFIPNYPILEKSSESLNISTATAVVCSEFRRRIE